MFKDTKLISPKFFVFLTTNDKTLIGYIVRVNYTNKTGDIESRFN